MKRFTQKTRNFFLFKATTGPRTGNCDTYCRLGQRQCFGSESRSESSWNCASGSVGDPNQLCSDPEPASYIPSDPEPNRIIISSDPDPVKIFTLGTGILQTLKAFGFIKSLKILFSGPKFSVQLCFKAACIKLQQNFLSKA